nr:hypothetical protein OG999_02520 [Streptomyces sp. NBC_00886]
MTETSRRAAALEGGGRAKFVVAGVAIVAIAVHLTLGGTVLARMRWTGWIASLLVTVVVGKVALVGGLALRRHGRRAG